MITTPSKALPRPNPLGLASGALGGTQDLRHRIAIPLRVIAAGELGRQAVTSSGPVMKGNHDRFDQGKASKWLIRQPT
jgi:hypothetical protein